MPKHILFDFGGVILDLDGVHTGYPDDLAEIFGTSVAEAQRIWDANKKLVLTGLETPLQFLHRMNQELQKDFDPSAELQHWERKNYITTDRIDWELIEHIKDLKKRYHIHMLTDQIALDNGAAEWKHEFEQHFDTIFRSYEQGLRKPSPAAYQNVLLQLSARPEDVIFIDDAPANIAAANKLGIRGILYKYKQHHLLPQ